MTVVALYAIFISDLNAMQRERERARERGREREREKEGEY